MAKPLPQPTEYEGSQPSYTQNAQVIRETAANDNRPPTADEQVPPSEKGDTLRTAGRAAEATGSVTRGTGVATKAVGSGMQKAGGALSRTGVGAVVGVPLAALGTGVKIAGSAAEKAGKAAQKAGKTTRGVGSALNRTQNARSIQGQAVNDNELATTDAKRRGSFFGNSIEKTAAIRKKNRQGMKDALTGGLGTTRNFGRYARASRRAYQQGKKVTGRGSFTGIKIATALAPLWWVMVVFYILQIIGAIITIMGLAIYFGVASVPLIGDFIADISGSDNLMVIGMVFSLMSAAIMYLIIALGLMWRRVALLEWGSLLVMIVTLFAHMLPIINFFPLVGIWLGYLWLHNKHG